MGMEAAGTGAAPDPSLPGGATSIVPANEVETTVLQRQESRNGAAAVAVPPLLQTRAVRSPDAASVSIAPGLPSPTSSSSSLIASPKGKKLVLIRRTTGAQSGTTSTPSAATATPAFDATPSATPISPTTTNVQPVAPATPAAATIGAVTPASPTIDTLSYPAVQAAVQRIEAATSVSTAVPSATVAPAGGKRYTLARKIDIAAQSPVAASAISAPVAAVPAEPSPSASLPASATADGAGVPVPPSQLQPESTSQPVPATAVLLSNVPTEASTSDNHTDVQAAVTSPVTAPPPILEPQTSMVAPAVVVAETTVIPVTPAKPIAAASSELLLSTPIPAAADLTATTPFATPMAAPIQAFSMPASAFVPDASGANEVQAFVPSPSLVSPPPAVPVAASAAESPAVSRNRTPTRLLDEHLPALDAGAKSRRQSLRAVSTQYGSSVDPFDSSAATVGMGSVVGPAHHHAASSNWSMDSSALTGVSKSRRNSLSHIPLPPIHSNTPSISTQVALPASTTVVPFALPPPSPTSPIDPAVRRPRTPEVAGAFQPPVSPSMASPATPDPAHPRSPSVDIRVRTAGASRDGRRRGDKPSTPTLLSVDLAGRSTNRRHSRGPSLQVDPAPSVNGSASRHSSRVFVGPLPPLLQPPSTSAGLASQLQQARASADGSTPPPSFIFVQEHHAARVRPLTRWLWTGFAAFGIGLLLFSLLYALVHPDGGYSALNRDGDRVVLASCLLYACGLALLLVVAVLFFIRSSVFTSATGGLFQLALTASLLGVAGLLSNQDRSALLSVLGSTPVLIACQVAFVGACWMFLMFAVWLHGAPSRTTQAVLLLLDGLDLSALNKDIRTLRGMNAELIQAHTAAIAKRGMPPSSPAMDNGEGMSPVSPDTAQAPRTPGETRPFTSHTRPGTALLEIPSYARGTYDDPRGALAGTVAPGTANARAHRRASHGSSMGTDGKSKRATGRSSANFSQFLSVGGAVLATTAAPAANQSSETPLFLPPPQNFALPPSATRRSSADGNAMKMMMAQNVELTTKVRELEQQHSDARSHGAAAMTAVLALASLQHQSPKPAPSGRVADGMDSSSPPAASFVRVGV